MKKRADGRYQLKVTLPNGEAKMVYGRTQQEVKDKRDELKLQYAMGKTVVDKKITVQQWMEKWWKAAKEGQSGFSSQRGYVAAMNNYIFPEIGPIKLHDIKPIHIQNMINKMGQAGKSESLQRQVLIALNGAFQYAVINGLLIGNPAQYVKKVSVEKHVRDALTSEEIKKLTEVVKGSRAEIAIHLALYCGLRRGEIVALRWDNVDLVQNKIYITEAVEYRYNKPEPKGPKSKAGNRTIPIPPHLVELLKSAERTCEYVCPSAKNIQMSEQSVRRLIEPARKKLDFYFSFHILRHTYASLLDLMDVNPTIRQYLMGHAELSTTQDYTHIMDEHMQIASEKVSDIFAISQRVENLN